MKLLSSCLFSDFGIRHICYRALIYNLTMIITDTHINSFILHIISRRNFRSHAVDKKLLDDPCARIFTHSSVLPPALFCCYNFDAPSKDSRTFSRQWWNSLETPQMPSCSTGKTATRCWLEDLLLSQTEIKAQPIRVCYISVSAWPKKTRLEDWNQQRTQPTNKCFRIPGCDSR